MNQTSDCMTALPWWQGFEPGPGCGLDSLALSIHALWRFLDLQPGQTTEFRSLGSRVRVAYPTNLRSAIALARQADTFTDSIGAFVVPNVISEGAASRYEPDCWHVAAQGCVRKAEVTHRRVVYIDVDAERTSGTNATSDEKRCARRLADKIETWLAAQLGDPRCMGAGDSGNGTSLFIAVDPEPCSPPTDERISDHLKRLAAAFTEPGAKVEISMSNPDRLVPLFGTMKRETPHTSDRPHRQTRFHCRAPVIRIPLSRIVRR